jgi:hypothetical protein
VYSPFNLTTSVSNGIVDVALTVTPVESNTEPAVETKPTVKVTEEKPKPTIIETPKPTPIAVSQYPPMPYHYDKKPPPKPILESQYPPMPYHYDKKPISTKHSPLTHDKEAYNFAIQEMKQKGTKPRSLGKGLYSGRQMRGGAMGKPLGFSGEMGVMARNNAHLVGKDLIVMIHYIMQQWVIQMHLKD